MTVAMTKPVVTHVICSMVTPSEPVRCGTATLTIEASMAPMSVPKVIDTVTSHLLTGLRSSRVVVPPAAFNIAAAEVTVALRAAAVAVRVGALAAVAEPRSAAAAVEALRLAAELAAE